MAAFTIRSGPTGRKRKFDADCSDEENSETVGDNSVIDLLIIREDRIIYSDIH